MAFATSIQTISTTIFKPSSFSGRLHAGQQTIYELWRCRRGVGNAEKGIAMTQQQEIDIVRGSDLISNLRREMDRLFSQFAFPLGGRFQQRDGDGQRIVAPPTDIAEEDTAYRVVMEIPGIDPKNVEVNVAGQTLAVRATQQQDQEQKTRNYLLSERSFGLTQRQFRIPDDVDTGQISAEFRNGVLAVTLPKSQQAQQQRRNIEIKSS
jgi:HSP20 family protein